MQRTLKSLIQQVGDVHALHTLAECLETGDGVEVNGAVGSLRSIVLTHLFKKLGRDVLWVFETQERATRAKEDLEHLQAAKASLLFPEPRKNKWGEEDIAVVTQQAEVLDAFLRKSKSIVLASYSALAAKIRSPQEMMRQSLFLRVGMSMRFSDFIKQLSEIGFEREPVVEKPGEIAVRGGIVDVFPFTATYPLRIEFWGDDIESIREFDAISQRSTLALEQAKIMPRPQSEGEQSVTLLGALPPATLVGFDDAIALQKKLSGEQNTSYFNATQIDTGVQDSEDAWNAFLADFGPLQKLFFSPIKASFSSTKIDFKSRYLPPLNGDMKQLLKKFVANYEEQGGRNYFLCESPGHALRMEELFSDRGVGEDSVQVAGLSLHRGFALPQDGIFVYTDHEFYGRIRRQRVRRRFTRGLTLRQLKSLGIGDFVVHADYGVGRYRGLEKIQVRNHERECLLLEYRDDDKLYVPLDRMDRVEKYSGKDGKIPRIHKLGSPEWDRLKKRTKARVRDIAKELIQLYAMRRAQQAFTFSPDTTWQKELEASFIHEDTPDQVKATRDIKQDMESTTPMDRLICGDVGYGKTEVAVRAAFKAVQDGKQVAVLVPTTILAEQHYLTFRERLQKFPVHVEVLSRFRSAKEQKRIVAQVKSGEVDVVIGTHRLLSKDVEFKNIGLLVIDEEQRFGVRHKERLKQLRVDVDVLTLTATPIPRTLQMSLFGVRDMSQINTPPRDRLPIHTEIMEFDQKFVREAVLREVERGGQIFFVHNRVESIYDVADRLARLVPEVDMAVAHGQMRSTDLENVMMDFMHRHYHVLVTTMIIESGLDMPNVNTIFINRADRFGLAQLYQLRGRVGRSNHKAYCYLLVPPVKKLTTEAIQRLETIEQFTELGSGIHIAMRDLEIRGAGNFLGAEQSGFIESMGMETYLKILDEAVRDLRKDALISEAPEEFAPDECKIDADVDAYLPQNYVELAAERVEAYRRLAHASQIDDVDAIREEVRDRFGRLPREAENLFNLAAARVLGRQAGFKLIKTNNRLVVGYFYEKLYTGRGDDFRNWLSTILSRANRPMEFIQENGLALKLQFELDENPLTGLVELLRALTAVDASTTNKSYQAA